MNRREYLSNPDFDNTGIEIGIPARIQSFVFPAHRVFQRFPVNVFLMNQNRYRLIDGWVVLGSTYFIF